MPRQVSGGTAKQSRVGRKSAKAATPPAATSTVSRRRRPAAAPAASSSATSAAARRKRAAPAAAIAPAVAAVVRRGPGLPRTLSYDIGGTGLKASVLSKHGDLLHEPVHVPTPYPLPPKHLVAALTELAVGLPTFQRVSAGFPGMVRAGLVLSAPHFISPAGPEHKPSPDLQKAWDHFDLQSELAAALGKPCRVANDADVQGSAVVKGEGLELVITLGTGVGTALFWQGKLAPHLELAHHPLGKDGATYNEVLGEAVRQKVGNKKWNARLERTLSILRALIFFDHCYIGGGNSKRVTIPLPGDVTLADNTAGILGGIKLWERG